MCIFCTRLLKQTTVFKIFIFFKFIYTSNNVVRKLANFLKSELKNKFYSGIHISLCPEEGVGELDRKKQAGK